jgi:two-component system sporulation sensor kinase A
MPTGGTIKIRTGLLPEANEIYIDIQDNGLGIPPERLEDIGVPFFTTKDSGTGLGLSISYAIIDAHGGRIEVDSKENRGTTFRIILPGYSG